MAFLPYFLSSDLSSVHQLIRSIFHFPLNKCYPPICSFSLSFSFPCLPDFPFLSLLPSLKRVLSPLHYQGQTPRQPPSPPAHQPPPSTCHAWYIWITLLPPITPPAAGARSAGPEVGLIQEGERGEGWVGGWVGRRRGADSNFSKYTSGAYRSALLK